MSANGTNEGGEFAPLGFPSGVRKRGGNSRRVDEESSGEPERQTRKTRKDEGVARGFRKAKTGEKCNYKGDSTDKIR